VEDVDGRLSVSERSIPTIEQKDKEADKYDRNNGTFLTERHLEQYGCA